jgi:hypothetical protein
LGRPITKKVSVLNLRLKTKVCFNSKVPFTKLEKLLKYFRIEPKEPETPDGSIKRSEYVAYDMNGRAVEDHPADKPVKRSGFVGSDDHEFTDDELEEQVRVLPL